MIGFRNSVFARARFRVMRGIAGFAQKHPYLFAVCIIASTAIIIAPWRGTMDESMPGMWFLLAIVGVASLAGERGAVAAAVVAFGVWNFVFIPPYYTFTIAEPHLWFNLIAFLIVGSAVGLQAAIRKRREREIGARERETALLNHLLERLVAPPSADDVPMIVLTTIDEALAPIESAAYVNHPDAPPNRTWLPSPITWPAAVEARVAETGRSLRSSGASDVRMGESSGGHPAALMFVPLVGSSRAYGVLYVALDPQTGEGLAARQLVMSVAAIFSAYLERAALQRAAIEVDALRAADEMKSGFVASVSHELKTPLASALATVTGLLEPGESATAPDATTRDELEAVVEDLRRLEANIVDLLDISRLENAAWELKLDEYEVGEVIADVLAGMAPAARTRVRLCVEDDIPPVTVDFRQIARALRNLTDNALAYSPADSPVSIGARVLGDAVLVWVEDTGPGIPRAERAAVFQKFYRGSTTPRTANSTGLGLAITREILARHDGSVWIEDVVPHGARFAFSLPLRHEGSDR